MGFLNTTVHYRRMSRFWRSIEVESQGLYLSGSILLNRRVTDLARCSVSISASSNPAWIRAKYSLSFNLQLGTSAFEAQLSCLARSPRPGGYTNWSLPNPSEQPTVEQPVIDSRSKPTTRSSR